MTRSLIGLFRGAFALALLIPVSLVTVAPAAAAAQPVYTIAPTTMCGEVSATTGIAIDIAGHGLICEVTIVNTVATGGSGSATVTVRECLGSYSDPTDGAGVGGFPCTTKTTVLTAPVTAVDQCNNSINGGGSWMQCSVTVTNILSAGSPNTNGAATVNQCIGSAAGGIVGSTINCDPIQDTTSATITQCNGSANGLTLVGLTCTAAGTAASAFPFTITQCNKSANGGGNLVTCTASITNRVAAAVTPAPVLKTPPPTSTIGSGSSDSPTPLLPLMLLLALSGFALAAIVMQRRTMRS
jgi:hypothetical protein